MGKYIFVYQTICGRNNKSYIGVHSTNNIDDGYIGCGIFKQSDAHRDKLLLHRAVRKYGYTSFRKYILSFFDTYQEALDEERVLVDKDWVTSNQNYNAAIGGRGSWIYHLSSERKKDIYRRISQKNRGRKRTPEFRRMLSEKKKGVKLSEPHKAALKKNNARYWLGKKKPESSLIKQSISLTGRKISAEAKRKMSESAKNRSLNYFKPIIQYNTDGVLVNEYQSARQAGRELGCLHTSIQNNLVGRTKSCNGFIFKYKGGL